MFEKVFQLVGLIVLGTHVCSYQFNNIDKHMKYFAISVEYVVHKFNEDQDDEFAYKFLQVWRSQHQRWTWIFLIDLELGRTICKKYEEDIDSCPLQHGPGAKKVRCIYIVESLIWITQFKVMNSTCIQT
ncbi:cystatin-12-like [Dipodomys merriami]|uniref:cystatin-12-like n=1 Tax=Dipodomys merriami TaxID=94247 RepID=UPI003855F59D